MWICVKIWRSPCGGSRHAFSFIERRHCLKVDSSRIYSHVFPNHYLDFVWNQLCDLISAVWHNVSTADGNMKWVQPRQTHTVGWGVSNDTNSCLHNAWISMCYRENLPVNPVPRFVSFKCKNMKILNWATSHRRLDASPAALPEVWESMIHSPAPRTSLAVHVGLSRISSRWLQWSLFTGLMNCASASSSICKERVFFFVEVEQKRNYSTFFIWWNANERAWLPRRPRGSN